MALILSCDGEGVISLEEYIEYIEKNMDVHDEQSIIDAAPMLRLLANNKVLVVNHLNELVKIAYKGGTVPSSQAIFLGGGTNFYVRANIWPSTADMASGKIFQDDFSYYLTHDHTYNFVTAAYSGSGYFTEIYEYDRDRIEGYIGEPVDLRYIERVHFQTGMVMFYRAGKDVHTQYPPDSLSISLNLMISTPEVVLRDQFSFDVEKSIISDIPRDLDSSRRVSIVEMAGYTGNEQTQDLLNELARRHPCRRTRLAAYESLVKLTPGEAFEIWEAACTDREPLVVNAARRRLAALSSA